jgi:hypothetical protein
MEPVFSKIDSFTSVVASFASEAEKSAQLKGLKLTLTHKVQTAVESSIAALENFAGRETSPKTLAGRAEKSEALETEIARNKMRQIEAKVLKTAMTDLSRFATTAEESPKTAREALKATKKATEGLLDSSTAANRVIKHLETIDVAAASKASAKIAAFLSPKIIENIAKSAASKAKDKLKKLETKVEKLSESEDLREDLTAVAYDLKESASEYIEDKATEVFGEDAVAYSKALKVVAKAKMKETFRKVSSLIKSR